MSGRFPWFWLILLGLVGIITATIAALIRHPELGWIGLLYSVSSITAWIWQRNYSYGQLRWKQVVINIVICTLAIYFFVLTADRALDALETTNHELLAISMIFLGVTSGSRTSGIGREGR